MILKTLMSRADTTFRAYVLLAPDETPGVPEWNAIARNLHCDADDLSITSTTRLNDDASATNTAWEYIRMLEAQAAGQALYRVRGFRQEISPPGRHGRPVAGPRTEPGSAGMSL